MATHTPDDYRELIDLFETWMMRRKDIASGWDNGASRASLDNFVETMNYHSRQLIAAFGKTDPSFWDAVVELATNAGTIASKAKIVVDGRNLADR